MTRYIDADKTTDLKPCPFCGKKVKADSFEHADGRVGWSVTCWDCYADMGHYDSLEELAKHWNRRASPKMEVIDAEIY